MNTFVPYFNKQRIEKHRKVLEYLKKRREVESLVKRYENRDEFTKELQTMFLGKKGTYSKEEYFKDAEYTQHQEYHVIVTSIKGYVSPSKRGDGYITSISTTLKVEWVQVGNKNWKDEEIDAFFNNITDYNSIADTQGFLHDIASLRVSNSSSQQQFQNSQEAFKRLNFAFGYDENGLDSLWPYNDVESFRDNHDENFDYALNV